jgi:uncharacterized DUF497 family protein
VFEWDPVKAAGNLEKHGCHLKKPRQVFKIDSRGLDGPDIEHSTTEPRRLHLGQSIFGRLLVVAYTLRRHDDEKETIRIISARLASKKERQAYADRKIDFSDIPEMSDDQLRAMRRVGRPTLGDVARQLIAIRIDPQVLEHLRKEAQRQDIGYQTLINNILTEHAKKKTA